ncbi:hypothetical protein KK062_27185 [Fulvivirgaceae bacterium PWU5]|uniref:Uncharacterized protein n=1 Tax=Dawidia cretensis TaxID=2782350 RepID=A0AAP2GX13_9BACT|nr:hypothetical protein [Dawidia cretensis]MBT1711957.1 hypothetical protein [Dawidia cretensis]
MSLSKVLEDWSDYDNRKQKKEDSHFFSCTEKWEIDYLVDKIHEAFGYLDRLAIRDAITHFCNRSNAPHPRKIFVTSVLMRLGVVAS